MVAIGGMQKFSTVDYPGHVVAAIFTIGCNMRCGYCHNPELVLPERYAHAIPERQILDFLQTRIGKLDGVAISGGEPMEQPDLPQFIRAIKAMGFKVKLDTNGTHPDMLRQLLNENLLDFVAMDIKGPLAKYSKIAARPVNINHIQQSIALIKTVPHEFRTTIVRSQLCPADFEQIGELVHGANRFALQYYVRGDTVSPQMALADTFTAAEMTQAFDYISHHVKECVVH